VGKNEAGKTALLSALRGLRPNSAFIFDETNDYPRRFARRFDERHPNGSGEVIRTWWKLERDDIRAVSNKFGEKALSSDVLEVHFGFRYEGNKRIWNLEVNEKECLIYLTKAHGLDAAELLPLSNTADAASAVKALTELSARTAKQEALLKDLQNCRDTRFTLAVLDILDKRMPSFFYTSHFERMSGEISLNQLAQDKAANTVSPGDKIFLDFLEYAGTSLEELQQTQKRESLKAQCESAGNDITDEIFQFWSQNSALEVLIDFEAAKPGDKPPFNTGIIAQVRIRNNNHKASLPLSERSAGFVWFFSFLAQFKQLKKTTGNAVILLDEPGLTLHGKAQGDLLRYISDRLLPQHQVIFTTHSPFMVPADRLQDVRIVEDVVDHTSGKAVVKGTKVRSDVLEVEDDTLFPLQGALGYEITQTLFVGPNTLLVEGPSDILYIEALKQALKRRGRPSLSARWTLSPSGGIDRIAPFARLFGGNKINIAVLSDMARGDVSKVDKLRKSQILKAGHFYTFADFLNSTEADVEDLFGLDRYAALLNAAYSVPAAHIITADRLNNADTTTPRVVKKAEALFRLMPESVAEFDHFLTSDWLIKNPAFLDESTPEIEALLKRAEDIFIAYNKLLAE